MSHCKLSILSVVNVCHCYDTPWNRTIGMTRQASTIACGSQIGEKANKFFSHRIEPTESTVAEY